MRDIDEVTGEVVDAAYRIHTHLGPGLLESVYEAILEQQLLRRGLSVERQKPVPIQYDGLTFDEGFRMDLLVDGRVVVELKSVECIAPVHAKQLLTYLRLMNLRVGLLINFGAANIREGVRRMVNGYSPTPRSSLRINRAP
jgi:iron complex transport system substrate-binding protein